MFSQRIKTSASSAIGAAAIGLTALAAAGVASATSTDETFMQQMKSLGIEFSSPQAANHAGKKVCQALSHGESGVDLAREVVSQTDMTTHQAAYFVVYATTDYCPEYTTQLNA
jgi:NADPH:quinone reductase-like Zn-dependent oxidoreductase